MYKVTILLKSGNVLKLKCKTFKLTKNGHEVTGIVHEVVDVNLMHLDVTQIEAVHCRKVWF